MFSSVFFHQNYKNFPNWKTIEQVEQEAFSKYSLKMSGIFHNVSMVYYPLALPNHKQRYQKPLKDFLKNVKENFVDLVVTYQDVNGKDINGPVLRLHVI